MSWEKILKENKPNFNSIEELLEWMVNNQIKNGVEIHKIFEKIVEDNSKTLVQAERELRPHTMGITREHGLRLEWIRLLDETPDPRIIKPYE
tara:strand:+ start:500 stop:775 length:276 start_codon:yes stop_codon:yes gene_type:complete